MRRADVLQEHPEIGRRVPEHRNPAIREIVFRPYRLIYRVRQEEEVVGIARVWHGARGTPSLP